jgi:membrane fusion protein, multidrug efflux system
MIKRIVLAVLAIILVIGALAGIKGLQIGRMVAQSESFVPPPETVTQAEAQTAQWENVLTSVGSLEAVQGVMVSAEVPGKVVGIDFVPGAKLNAGALLVQQDISTETAQLRSAETQVNLTRAAFERARQLLPEKVISQSDFDDAEAQHQQALAQLENIRTVIAKKAIRAPFAGRVGIRLVNLGQTLEQGQAIASLQALDPIFVNFLLPQQQLSLLEAGLPVRVTTDALPGGTITGEITAINPEVDPATRNIRVQATVANSDERLRPGMYVNVEVVLPHRQEVLVIPITAVAYAPYSDSVFVVEEQPANGEQEAGMVVRQQFIKLGEKRGDFVTVRSGLKPGQKVVSSGVFKLRNGQPVVVNNELEPEFKLDPRPEDA